MIKFLLLLSLIGVCFSSEYFTQTHSGIVSFGENNFGKFYGQTFRTFGDGNFTQVMIEVEILNPETLLPLQNRIRSGKYSGISSNVCMRDLNIIFLRDNYFMGKNFERLSSKNVKTWKNSDIYHYTLSEGKLQIILNMPKNLEKISTYSENPYFIYFMVENKTLNSENFEDCDRQPTVFNYTRYQK